MNDQSPNDILHASSFLQGHNAEYVEQLYARYADNPGAVMALFTLIQGTTLSFCYALQRNLGKHLC